MVVAGVVLVAIAAVLVAAAVTSNGHGVKTDLWGLLHPHLSVGTVFLSGMVTTVLAVVGVVVLVGGLRRSRRRRRDRKQVEKNTPTTAPKIDTGPIDFTKPIDFNSERFNVGGTDSSGKSSG